MITRDIRQKDKPESLADDQEEYEVWVRVGVRFLTPQSGS
jgi:hypothetical protein